MKKIIPFLKFYTRHAHCCRLSATLLLWFVYTGGLFAQGALPALLVQGTLTQADGTALDDTIHTVTFKLWTEPGGDSGTAVFTETIPNVKTVGGVYSVVLGRNGTPITAPFDRIYYLGVTVGANGNELLTRPPLTHAPYTLSLLGKSNKFPPAGLALADSIKVAGMATIETLQVTNAVTIDTLQVAGIAQAGAFVANSGAPDMPFAGKGYAFGAGGDTDGGLFSTADGVISIYTNGAERLKVEGPRIDLKQKALAADFGGAVGHGYRFGDPDSGLSGSGSEVKLTGYGTDRIHLTSGGNEFHGITKFFGEIRFDTISSTEADIDFIDPIVITQDIDYTDYPLTGLQYHEYTNTGVKVSSSFGNASFDNISLRAAGTVVAEGYYAISDKRVKKDFSRVNAAEALAQLLRLQVTDYRYIDEIAKGRGQKKGFIAQEVEAVEPAAVMQSTGFIPSVYAPAEHVRASDRQFVFSMARPHGLQKGDRVRIFEGAVRHDMTVEEATETAFSVAMWSGAVPANAFVFGKEVADFKEVNYDYLFTVNVAATQELARRAEILEQELSEILARNAALRAENTGLETAQTALDNQLRELFGSLKLLEAPGANSVEK